MVSLDKSRRLRLAMKGKLTLEYKIMEPITMLELDVTMRPPPLRVGVIVDPKTMIKIQNHYGTKNGGSYELMVVSLIAATIGKLPLLPPIVPPTNGVWIL